jgi:hypothetical protein
MVLNKNISSMKPILFLLIASSLLFAQDSNLDGKLETPYLKLNSDINGDGIRDIDITFKTDIFNNLARNSLSFSTDSLSFSLFWSSPAGAFSNCWDGAAGFFDGDTLLDVAGYTFNPNKLYIWEQVPGNPDSFAVVVEFTKAESGGYGPIVFGDTDGDGKIEIITADFSTLTRVYVYENDGDNTYVDKGTQSSMTHTNNGETAQALFIGDLNKNGKKEIICMRGNTSGGEVRIWEQTGAIGSNTYSSIYTYTTVSYLFGKGGLGDSNNNGWDEVLLTFGGLPVFNTFIRRIEFDSTSTSFQHYIFEASSIGFPTSYKVYDLNGDGIKELISTNNSNGIAASYVFRSTGQNQYDKIDSIFESSDNNSMMSLDIKVLSGNTFPSIVYGSFNGRTYVYRYNGSFFTKEYENLNYPGPAVRRVYWLPWTGYDGFFNTWSSSSSNGTLYIFKLDIPVGIGTLEKIPREFILHQNFPNPFNPNTIIRYELPKQSSVTLHVFDITGKLITTLVDEVQSSGKYEVSFSSAGLSSGIYFYKLKAGSFSDTKKMILLK